MFLQTAVYIYIFPSPLAHIPGAYSKLHHYLYATPTPSQPMYSQLFYFFITHTHTHTLKEDTKGLVV